MKLSMTRFIFAAAVLACGVAYGADRAHAVATARTNYMDVASHLEQGGDLYVIGNLEGALQSAMEQVAAVVEAMPAGAGTCHREARDVASRAVSSEAGGLRVARPGHERGSPDGQNSIRLYVGSDAGAAASQQFGTSINALMSTLGDEGFVSLQLSKTATVTIPVGDAPLSIPAPSFLLAMAVRDATLRDLAVGQMTNSGLPMLKSKVGEAELDSLGMPLPLPIAIQPTLALHKGFLLLGSSPDVVKAALEAEQAGGGLVIASEFKAAFKGQDVDNNNGLIYMSPRLGAALIDVQRTAMASAGGADGRDRDSVLRQGAVHGAIQRLRQ